MARKRNRKKPFFIPQPPRTLETAISKFDEYCEVCHQKLEVIKFKQGSKKHKEVITATCFNSDFHNLKRKCPQYGIEIRFRHCRWF
jgi:hypothetical protein